MPLAPEHLAFAVCLVLVFLVVVATIVNRFAPERRARLRTPALLASAYVLLALLLFAARAGDVATAVRWLDFAARLAGGFAAVNLGALLAVDVILPRLRLPFPSIVADLLAALGYGAVTAVAIADTGIDPTSAVAGTTVVAAVLTISLQSTLGNVIGGVALQLDGSVHVGDWLQLENGRQGRVSAIRWRHVTLDTRDGDTIILPNSLLLATPFTILGRRDDLPHPHRQAIHFRVDYRFAPSKVIGAVLDALRASPIPNVRAEPLIDCVCVELGRDAQDSTALYAVRYWIVDVARDTPTDSEVRSRVHAALRRNSIPIALPATTTFNADLDHLGGQAQRQRRRERANSAVRGVELFRALTDAECEQLASTVNFYPFAAGEVITRQGAVAHHLYLVAAGEVEVRVLAEGTEATVSRIRAPGFFGEMGLLTGAPRKASVYAVSATECFKLERAAFEGVIHNRPEVARELGAVLAKRQMELEAVTSHADAAGRAAKEREEAERIGERIRAFFGLET